MFFSRQRNSGWMAILLNEEAVTLAHVVRTPGTLPEVRMLESFQAERSEKNTLHRLKGAKKLKSYRCATLMPAGTYTFSAMDAPPVPTEERRDALRWSLKELVNFPVETACLTVLETPHDNLPTGRSVGVLVVMADELVVRRRAQPFEENAIPLDAIDVAESAQRNVAALLEDDNRGLALLRIDKRGMMLTLSFRAELVAVRTSEITSEQLVDADPEQRARVMERLVLELQRSLDNFDRQYSYIPISKVLVAVDQPVENLLEELSPNVYLPLQMMDLATVLNFDRIPALKDLSYQASHLLALGTALRDEMEVAS